MTRLSNLRKTADAAIGADGLDSAQVTTIATDAGIAVYTALDSLPSSGLSSGDQAWVESSGRLYISNGSGWYNIALVNASPTLTLDQSGTIQLNADTLTVTVIASATDSDDNQDMITFSVESDGNMVGTGTTISQDSSVFTITADSEGGNGVAGDFTLTFKATDGIAVDNEALSFSLVFSTIVDSSAETILLMKAASNNVGNTTIKYIDSAESESTWTTTGLVTASTFSPYRSGGYSAHFDGADDYLTISDDNSLDVGTGDFTLEAWFYLKADDGTYNICCQYSSGNTGGLWLGRYSSGFVFRRAGVGDVITADAVPSVGEWHHVAVSRASGSTKMFIDGTQTGSTVSSDTNNYSVSAPFYIGIDTPTDAGEMNGYIRDFRLIKGTGLYTTDFTPPTESLTAVSGTSLLACHLPYFADGSTNDHTITVNGNTSTSPFGPYDYSPWNDSDHGGSIYLNGEGNYLSHTAPSDVQTLGRQNQSMTLEAWIRPVSAPSNYAFIYGIGTNASTAGNNLWGLEIGTSYQLRGAVNGAYTTAAGMPTTSNNVIKPNVWNHVALVQNAGSWVIYVNGKSEATQGNTSYTSGTTHTVGWVGRSHYDDNRYFPGYISNLRIHDTAIYTSAFTPPTSPVTTPKLLLNQAGADANIYDAAAANPVEVNGSVTNNTTRKFTTSSSVYFDGTSDALEFTPGYDDPRYLLGTVDWTIEGWVYPTNLTSNHTIFSFIKYNSSGGRNTPYVYSNGTSLRYWTDGADRITGSAALTLNTWHHIAVTRSGDDHKLFVDGTQVGSTWNNAADYVQGRPTLGDFYQTTNTLSNGSEFAGYIQDFRFTKGYARYTANFTAPTAEFDL